MRTAFWLRAVSLGLLLVGFFAPLPGLVAAAVIGLGLLGFLAGALPWLVGDREPWLRR